MKSCLETICYFYVENAVQTIQSQNFSKPFWVGAAMTQG